MGKKVLYTLLFLLSFVTYAFCCEPTGKCASILYDSSYLSALSGGFSDTISGYAEEEGLSVEAFSLLCSKSSADMSERELSLINRIRCRQLRPIAETLMQKVITLDDMKNYLSGKYRAPKGFLSVCADVKQYVTVEDYYYGLRLDYAGSAFRPDAPGYAVIRFKAANIERAVVPRAVANGGTFKDPYPFGGAGFTTGTNGRTGSPEWVLQEFAVMDDGAQIFEIFADGTEKLRAVYSAEAGRFFETDEN